MFRRKLQKILPSAKLGLIFFTIILVIFGGIKLFQFVVKQKLTPQVLWQVLTVNPSVLKQNSNRTNILLAGIGGSSHEGGDLTDTMMVASIDFTAKDLVLISIPRDIWVASFKDKINAAYRIGEAKQKTAGFILAKAAVEEVVGLPIHYGVIIDFSGFVSLVDNVGGIDVPIEETFIDDMYPIAGAENDLCNGDIEYKCRYESIIFTKGTEHMDGARALKYVRSRHAVGDAGTDFSRGKRQETVMVALKNKILSRQSIFDVKKLVNIMKLANKSLLTDMLWGEELVLARNLTAKMPDIRSYGISWDQPQKKQLGLLINPPTYQYENLWVLVPKHGNYDKIRKYITCVVDNLTTCERLYE